MITSNFGDRPIQLINRIGNILLTLLLGRFLNINMQAIDILSNQRNLLPLFDERFDDIVEQHMVNGCVYILEGLVIIGDPFPCDFSMVVEEQACQDYLLLSYKIIAIRIDLHLLFTCKTCVLIIVIACQSSILYDFLSSYYHYILRFLEYFSQNIWSYQLRLKLFLCNSEKGSTLYINCCSIHKI